MYHHVGFDVGPDTQIRPYLSDTGRILSVGENVHVHLPNDATEALAVVALLRVALDEVAAHAQRQLLIDRARRDLEEDARATVARMAEAVS